MNFQLNTFLSLLIKTALCGVIFFGCTRRILRAINRAFNFFFCLRDFVSFKIWLGENESLKNRQTKKTDSSYLRRPHGKPRQQLPIKICLLRFQIFYFSLKGMFFTVTSRSVFLLDFHRYKPHQLVPNTNIKHLMTTMCRLGNELDKDLYPSIPVHVTNFRYFKAQEKLLILYRVVEKVIRVHVLLAEN